MTTFAPVRRCSGVKILLLIGALVVVGASAVGSSATAVAQSTKCDRPRVVVASQHGRVLRCDARLVLRSANGRSKVLGLRYAEPGTPGTGAGGIRRVSIDGRFLAIEQVGLGKGPTYFSVSLIDVRTRRTVRSAGTGVVPPDRRDGGNEGIGTTTDFALEGDKVAWIARDEYSSTPRWEVWVMTPSGARRLDEGGAVEPGSLALGTRYVYWTRGGAPMRAPIA
jgi:hypothetical protein